MIVTGPPRTGDRPRAPDPPHASPPACGHHAVAVLATRIAQLVTDLDPKLVATALGMQDSGLLRYLADNVDRDRLERTARTSQRTRALQVLPRTP